MAGYVLRLPRTDEEGTFALVHTTQVRSKPLDMKLTGTDGLAPYVVTIRHSQAASFMVKNCPVQEEEWIEILSAMLRQEHVEGMEAVATVDSESALTITFRKRVRGITQRLGTIELKHNADEEIELFDWCGTSIEAGTKAQETLASVTAKSAELEETVRQLRSQLDELVEAKKSDEAELLEKFRDLLNEKKVKIREQQHALDAASGDKSGFIKFETSTQGDVGVARPAGKSRATKRKQPVHEEEDEDEELEAMDVDDEPKVPADASDEDRNTTDGETETASEDEEDEEIPAAASKPVPKGKGSKPSSSNQSANAPSSKTMSQPDEEPPKRRELPFNHKKQPSRAKKAAPPPAGDETDSDDEL